MCCGCDVFCGCVPLKKGLKMCAFARMIVSLVCSVFPIFVFVLVDYQLKTIPHDSSVVTKRDYGKPENAAYVAIFFSCVILLIEIVNVGAAVDLVLCAEHRPTKRLVIPSRVLFGCNVGYLCVVLFGLFFIAYNMSVISYSSVWAGGLLVSGGMNWYTRCVIRAVAEEERRLQEATSGGPQPPCCIISPEGNVYNYTTPVYGQPSQAGGLAADAAQSETQVAGEGEV